jgi:hypothetical protein
MHPLKWLRRAAACLLVLTCSHVPIGAQAVPGSNLFLEAPEADRAAPPAATLRERFVRPRFDLFEADLSRELSTRRDRQLALNLFSDAAFTATLDRVTIESNEAFVWLGHLEGRISGTVTIAVRAGVMSGELRTATALYEIRFVGDGTHVVRQVDPATFPPDAEPLQVTLDPAELDRAASQPLADDGSLIDVMVVYTPAARIGAGGTAGIESLIDLAIANTNTSYANSAVIQRVRLVHKSEIAYTEVDFNSDLYSLTGTADGVLDNVHAMRDAFRADLVALVRQQDVALCGLAWLMSANSTASAPYGFSVNSYSCIAGNLTLAHEMGHNMSLNHDSATPPGPFPYTYGRGYNNGTVRDIMAVSSSVPRRQNFSNPAVNFVGSAMPSGTADRNGALALDNTRLAVANFREGAPAESDYNGDGMSDVLWRNNAGQTVMWLMSGNAVVGGGSLAPADASWRIVGNGDHNGDGKADVLWRHTTGTAVIWFMNGTAIVGGGGVATVDASYKIVGTGDFNADGRADILWRHDSGTVTIWLMSGIQIIGGGQVASVDPAWQISSTGDQNGDRRADILWRHTSGTTTVWLMNGTQIIGGGALADVDSSWRIVGTADYNADGRADILWRHTSGQIGMWFMDGSQVLSGSVFGAADPSWQVVGRGKYDASQWPDILWRHSSGQAAIWFMNGTAVLAGFGIGTTMDPTWQVVDPGQPFP